MKRREFQEEATLANAASTALNQATERAFDVPPYAEFTDQFSTGVCFWDRTQSLVTRVWPGRDGMTMPRDWDHLVGSPWDHAVLCRRTRNAPSRHARAVFEDDGLDASTRSVRNQAGDATERGSWLAPHSRWGVHHRHGRALLPPDRT